MRGGCFCCFAISAVLLSLFACAAPPPAPVPSPPAPAATTPPPPPLLESRSGGQVPLVHDPEGLARRSSTPNPGEGGRDPAFEDVLKLQKEVVAKNPASDEEKLRLALLHATAGQLEEADRVLSGVRSRTQALLPYFEFFLRRRLGDHKEAGKLLARFNEDEKVATGFVIERAELCSRIRRFRDTVPAETDRVAPGGVILLYVEPRNFTLQRDRDAYILHLKYEWKLYDDRSAELAVPAWERASAEEREDRLTTNGPISEFYQSFKLPLPANLASGRYRVRVAVTDAHTGKSDRVYVPITVAAPEKGR